MLQLLKDFLNEVGVGDKPANRFDRNDDRLAAAALLIHVMTVDGKETGEERDKLHELLRRQFNLDDDLTTELIEEATAADRESVDLYRFTSQLVRSLDEDGRRRVSQERLALAGIARKPIHFLPSPSPSPLPISWSRQRHAASRTDLQSVQRGLQRQIESLAEAGRALSARPLAHCLDERILVPIGGMTEIGNERYHATRCRPGEPSHIRASAPM